MSSSFSQQAEHGNPKERLVGAAEIAEYLWGSRRFRRRVYYLLEQEQSAFPVERDIWSGRLSADPARLDTWMQKAVARRSGRLKAG